MKKYKPPLIVNHMKWWKKNFIKPRLTIKEIWYMEKMLFLLVLVGNLNIVSCCAVCIFTPIICHSFLCSSHFLHKITLVFSLVFLCLLTLQLFFLFFILCLTIFRPQPISSIKLDPNITLHSFLFIIFVLFITSIISLIFHSVCNNFWTTPNFLN